MIMTRQAAVLSLVARINALQTIPLPEVSDPVNVLAHRSLAAGGRRVWLLVRGEFVAHAMLHRRAGKAQFEPGCGGNANMGLEA